MSFVGGPYIESAPVEMGTTWGQAVPKIAATGSPPPSDAPPPGRGGRPAPGGQGGPPDFFAQDQSLAAAMMLANPGADAQQAQQAGQTPQMRRMSTPPASSMHQGIGSSNDVWVTVPVDKVEVARGRGTITPTYSTQEGYRSPDRGNMIPPVMGVGKQ